MRFRRMLVVGALGVAMATSTSTNAVAAPNAAAPNAAAPRFCTPVKEAFHVVSTADANNYAAYHRAYSKAAKLLRTAAKSVHEDELAEALRHVGERYHEVVEEGELLEVGDISRLGPAFVMIGDVAEEECGFTIRAGSPTTAS